MIRHFSTKGPQKTSEFKSFFRLRIQDRPIRIAAKIKETYKKNKQIRRFIHYSKYVFAFGFLYFIFPGTFLPGQYTAKLLLIEVRSRITSLYGSLSKPSGSGEDFVKTIQFLSWKFHYLRKNGMLSAKLLADDLHTMCKMIDELSLNGGEAKTESSNTVIYECLSYINHTFLPNIIKHNISLVQKESLQSAILDLLDIISLRYETETQESLLKLKQMDSEEFLYRESLLTQYVNLCIILLKFNQSHAKHTDIYSLIEEILAKTGPAYDLAESFTTMEGIQLLLTDMNAEDSEERTKMGQGRSKEVMELRLKSLRMLRLLIEADDLVGVKLFKLKILSNLMTHTLKECSDQAKAEITQIALAFKRNQYREQLVTHSEDFKEERKRLEMLASNAKDYPYIDSGLRSSLADSLKVSQQKLS